jgi:hypothetical protein
MKLKYHKKLGEKVFELVASGKTSEEIGEYLFKYMEVLESEEIRDLRDEANGK